ncbi:MAG: radical SAM family heme chaperone HemW [Candidatus Dactylopiibacterium sp.]|nr:radical SAM family heme chaperone HemW [Candidatus Dactylopiibacterium sp.]
MHRTIPILPRAPASATPAVQLAAPPPLSLYIHFPWCVRKCPYCDFNSHNVKAAGIPEAAYLDALQRDLELALPSVWGRRVHTVFIGGGTPSLLSPEGLNDLLTRVRTLLPLEPDCEITLEANPGTVEAARFAAFRAAGVTRVSVGVQSFNEAHLQALGRIHGRAEALRALEAAATHFDTWNVDLMYALPRQTLAEAQADLEQALAFAPPHLSCYHLTLEPNTLYFRDPPPLPDDELAADMQEMMEARLTAAGYQHYETSAYARAGHRCRHNLNYWRFGDYLGIGAGAHGKLSDHLGVHRQMRHKHPNAYLDAVARGEFIAEAQDVGPADLPFEFMMNALRLTEGVPRSLFRERTGLPLEHVEVALTQARARGLLEIDAQHMRPTPLGQRFLNDLLSLFLQR